VIERTDAEMAAELVLDQQVRDVLWRCRDNITTYVAAEMLDPGTDHEHLIKLIYDELRAELEPEERLRAIVLLLQLRARRDAWRLVTAARQANIPESWSP
jgi:hypothetical protein